MKARELGWQGRERLGCLGKAYSLQKVAELFFCVEEQAMPSERAPIV